MAALRTECRRTMTVLAVAGVVPPAALELLLRMTQGAAAGWEYSAGSLLANFLAPLAVLVLLARRGTSEHLAAQPAPFATGLGTFVMGAAVWESPMTDAYPELLWNLGYVLRVVAFALIAFAIHKMLRPQLGTPPGKTATALLTAGVLTVLVFFGTSAGWFGTLAPAAMDEMSGAALGTWDFIVTGAAFWILCVPLAQLVIDALSRSASAPRGAHWLCAAGLFLLAIAALFDLWGVAPFYPSIGFQIDFLLTWAGFTVLAAGVLCAEAPAAGPSAA